MFSMPPVQLPPRTAERIGPPRALAQPRIKRDAKNSFRGTTMVHAGRSALGCEIAVWTCEIVTDGLPVRARCCVVEAVRLSLSKWLSVRSAHRDMLPQF